MWSSIIIVLLLFPGFQYYSDELSTEDKITLCIIEGYLDFKVKNILHGRNTDVFTTKITLQHMILFP